MIELPELWKQQWQGKDLFEQVLSLEGQEYRNMDGRRTLRFEKDDRGYFAKLYSGIGWPRIFKSLISLRKPPVLSAQNEWLAIRKLEKLGVDTMTLVGYGKQGRSPANRQSFIITEELQQTESLEDFCRPWPQQPPTFSLKRALIEKLATISRTLHESGVNHRDYYLCHFLLDLSSGCDHLDPQNLTVYLIDLHRVQFHKNLPKRWRLKDLAALYFSSMEIGLTQRDLYRFIQLYSQQPLREALTDHAQLWLSADQRANQLLRRFHKKYKV